jgi:hypothetical protein
MPARELNFDKFKSGEAHSGNSELGNHLSICLKTEENQENLCRDGRPQDLPDAYWLLASSPANESTYMGDSLTFP